MSEPAAIRLLDSAEGAEAAAPAPPSFVRRSVSLGLRGDTLHVVADVPERPMRLAEIVPFACAIDDRLMELYLRQAEAQHRPVFCRKGCSVCCSAYLIVFSPAEMYYQMETLDLLPAGLRRAVRERLAQTVETAVADGLVERLRNVGPDDKPLDLIEQWWQAQDDSTCAFLSDGACAIYPRRFIACREHYSHSPPERCAKRQAARMPLPLSLINALWQVEERLTGQPCGSLSLPLMRLWTDVRAAEAKRTWPAVRIVETLFDVLTETAAKASRLWAGAVVERRDDGPPNSAPG